MKIKELLDEHHVKSLILKKMDAILCAVCESRWKKEKRQQAAALQKRSRYYLGRILSKVTACVKQKVKSGKKRCHPGCWVASGCTKVSVKL
jgi:hypothetical protein